MTYDLKVMLELKRLCTICLPSNYLHVTIPEVTEFGWGPSDCSNVQKH